MAQEPKKVKINVVRGTVLDGKRIIPQVDEKTGKVKPITVTCLESEARLLCGSGHAELAEK
ncbi:MAG: hypothetical protein AAF542_17860 [Pseudomonadota bacterium]